MGKGCREIRRTGSSEVGREIERGFVFTVFPETGQKAGLQAK